MHSRDEVNAWVGRGRRRVLDSGPARPKLTVPLWAATLVSGLQGRGPRQCWFNSDLVGLGRAWLLGLKPVPVTPVCSLGGEVPTCRCLWWTLTV